MARYDDRHWRSFRAALSDGCEPKRRHRQVGYAFDPETLARYREVTEREATAVRIRSKVKQRPRPYRFDGDDFLELLGLFAAEGSVYDFLDCTSQEVTIAQEAPRHREGITQLFERLGIEFHHDDHSFSFWSELYGELLEKLCRNGGRSKRLPQLVWDCSAAQKQLLLDTLLAGDGNNDRTDYTVSEELARQVVCLCVETGTTPGYDRRYD